VEIKKGERERPAVKGKGKKEWGGWGGCAIWGGGLLKRKRKRRKDQKTGGNLDRVKGPLLSAKKKKKKPTTAKKRLRKVMSGARTSNEKKRRRGGVRVYKPRAREKLFNIIKQIHNKYRKEKDGTPPQKRMRSRKGETKGWGMGTDSWEKADSVVQGGTGRGDEARVT